MTKALRLTITILVEPCLVQYFSNPKALRVIRSGAPACVGLSKHVLPVSQRLFKCKKVSSYLPSISIAEMIFHASLHLCSMVILHRGKRLQRCHVLRGSIQQLSRIPRRRWPSSRQEVKVRPLFRLCHLPKIQPPVASRLFPGRPRCRTIIRQDHTLSLLYPPRNLLVRDVNMYPP